MLWRACPESARAAWSLDEPVDARGPARSTAMSSVKGLAASIALPCAGPAAPASWLLAEGAAGRRPCCAARNPRRRGWLGSIWQQRTRQGHVPRSLATFLLAPECVAWPSVGPRPMRPRPLPAGSASRGRPGECVPFPAGSAGQERWRLRGAALALPLHLQVLRESRCFSSGERRGEL